MNAYERKAVAEIYKLADEAYSHAASLGTLEALKGPRKAHNDLGKALRQAAVNYERACNE